MSNAVIQAELINRGRVVRRGRIDCDDWDAAIMEYLELAEDAREQGLWINITNRFDIPVGVWGEIH